MNRHRCVTTALAATAALTVLAACSPSNSDGSNSDQPRSSDDQAAGPVELKFWTNLTVDAQAQTISRQAADCVAGMEDVTVEFEAIPFDSMYSRMVTAFRSGDGPDVMNTIEGAVSFAQAGDYLVPVDDVIDEHGRDDFIGSYLDAVTKDEQTWAVPDWALHQEVWYRKDLFAAAGIQVPKSWPELLAAAEALDEGEGGVRGFAVPMSSALVAPQTWYQFLYANGVYTFDPASGEYALDADPEAAVEATDFMLQLYRTASPPESTTWTWTEFRNAFVEGDVAMVMDFGAVVGLAADQNPAMLDNMSAFPLPAPTSGDEPGGMLGGGYYYMVGKSTTAREAAAKELVACMMDADSVAERTNTRPVFALPATNSAAESTTYRENEVVQRFATEIATIRESSLPHWYRYGMEAGLNPLAGQIEATTFIGDALQAAAAGQTTPEEAFSTINEEMARLVEQ